MFHDVTQSVMDAIEACRKIQRYTAGQTQETCQADDMRYSAIERQFEILGEALNRVHKANPSFQGYLPEIGRIISMRNRISHGYDNVDDEVIWTAVEENVPALLEKLEAWLRENG